MNLHSIHLLVISSLLRWMKWNMGGMYLELSHYVRGMQTYFKYSFPLFQACLKMKPFPSIIFLMFQACEKMKPFSSIVSHVSSLCKKWNHSYTPVMISLLSGFFFSRWAFIFSFHRHHMFVQSYAFTLFLPFPEEPLWWVVLLASLLAVICFELFHHHWNNF